MGQSSTSSRLLALLALLQARRDWSGAELADRLEVSERTVRRDVDRLRGLGYPVESLTGPAGGYRLRAGTAMPPLLLDDEEAVAIAVGLRTAAGSGVTGIGETSLRAMVKLEQVLPARLRSRVEALGSATSMPVRRGPTVDAEALATVAGACRDRERLRFDYTDRTGAQVRRDVEPHALVNVGRRWYLVAWDMLRDDWRMFRLDRMERPWPGGRRFTPREIPGGDAVEYVARHYSSMPQPHEAVVTIHAPIDEVRGRRGTEGTLEPIDERTCRLRTGDSDISWLALRLVMIDVDFEVRGPPELVARIAELGDRLSRASSGRTQGAPADGGGARSR